MEHKDKEGTGEKPAGWRATRIRSRTVSIEIPCLASDVRSLRSGSSRRGQDR